MGGLLAASWCAPAPHPCTHPCCDHATQALPLLGGAADVRAVAHTLLQYLPRRLITAGEVLWQVRASAKKGHLRLGCRCRSAATRPTQLLVARPCEPLICRLPPIMRDPGGRPLRRDVPDRAGRHTGELPQAAGALSPKIPRYQDARPRPCLSASLGLMQPHAAHGPQPGPGSPRPLPDAPPRSRCSSIHPTATDRRVGRAAGGRRGGAAPCGAGPRPRPCRRRRLTPQRQRQRGRQRGQPLRRRGRSAGAPAVAHTQRAEGAAAQL